MSIQFNKVEDKMPLTDMERSSGLLPYPIDMSTLFPQRQFILQHGVPYQGHPAGYHPTRIAQYALVQWNQYLATNNEDHLKAFLTQAYWLVEHESRIGDDAGGWPIFFPQPDFHTRGPWLSALTQGSSISVLVRAYQLIGEEALLNVVRRVVRTFELDILDGGVSTPIGEDGVFFEEVAVYPAAHMLSGFIFAIFGLYDYVALTGDVQIEKLIHRSLATMHSLLEEFDVSFWTRSDLLHRRLASSSHLALQSMLLDALASYSGCDHCSRLALRWKGYQRQFGSRLHYLIASRRSSYSHALWKRVRTALFPRPQESPLMRVCVPLSAFPLTGGVLTVLQEIVQITKDMWSLEYMAQLVGEHSGEFVVHQFGTARMDPMNFPFVWFYVLTGFRKLISLMRQGRNYHMMLPQDGIFTGAFAALTAKIAGVRVVCIDHGNLTLLQNPIYRAERIQALATRHWLRRFIGRLQDICYWPSLYLLAWFAAHFIDHYMVPGVAGDGVEEICQQLGILSSRITRFASMVDIEHHTVLDAASKVGAREQKGIGADAIVVAMICRLSPEKGIDIALESISRALSTLPPDLRARVRFIIAGDGPLRKHVEEGIHLHKLDQTCALWGDISAKEVISLLAISDIFLYTSTRGACFAMAVLEAMASSCAVIASTQPISNALLLAEGRGIAVPADDVEQTSTALVRLMNDLELCRQMGNLARDYITLHHSAAVFRRTLMRTTYWSALDGLLTIGKNKKIVDMEMESEG